MKKTLLAGVATAALVASGGSVALADDYTASWWSDATVEVIANVDYDKNKDVSIYVNKDKDVDIDVRIRVRGNYAAEADAVVNQYNDYNYLDLSQQPPAFALSALLGNSVNDNMGITQYNQDVGYNVNQSNVFSAAMASNAQFSNSLAAVEQWNNENYVDIYGGSLTHPVMSATVTNSVNNNMGVTQVNQNTGAMNNQNNTVSLGIGDAANAVALSEADLGQFSMNNRVHALITVKTSTIANSVNANQGITTVNQTSGFFNNQSTTISIAGTTNLPN